MLLKKQSLSGSFLPPEFPLGPFRLTVAHFLQVPFENQFMAAFLDAVITGDLGEMRRLYEADCDITVTTVFRAREQHVQQWLWEKLSFDLFRDNDMTPLLRAASRAHYALAQWLLEVQFFFSFVLYFVFIQPICFCDK
jgi:hypothetical protein